MQIQQHPQQPKIHPVVTRLLEKRGEDNVEQFLSWDLNSLPLLTEMQDLEKAALRIIDAIDRDQQIGVFGDYDVDGTTSCALFYQFFKLIHLEIQLIQPSRFIDGYGLHVASIDRALELGIDLLLTVDCGITSVEAANYALNKGLDLIITDHHQGSAQGLPVALAVVNPNRRDEPEDSELKALAGVGVAFAVCVRVREMLRERGIDVPSLYPLLQFVAVGTICDLARLNRVNRRLVRHGLKQLPKTQYAGFRTFLNKDERLLPSISSEKCSFNIGPMINSKGRLEHPEMALKLLIETDSDKVREYYHQLEFCNQERKSIQNTVFEQAKKQVIQTMDEDHLISICYQSDWHEGVIGIVASKLVETFKVPAIVFSDSGDAGVIKASARSAGSLNLFELLDANRDLFLKFGGHKAAAGLSMERSNLAEFRTRINNFLQEVAPIERMVLDYYDLEIRPLDISPALLKDLDLLEPYGMGNPRPLFKMKGFLLESYDVLKEAHVKWNLKSKASSPQRFKGISFNYFKKWGLESPQELFHAQGQGIELTAYFTLSINHFKGNQFIQLMVDKMSSQDL